MRLHAEGETVRFVRLEDDAQARELEERSRAILARLSPTDPQGSDPPEVWVAGERNLEVLSAAAARGTNPGQFMLDAFRHGLGTPFLRNQYV